jgi:hypothetical protein
MNHQQGFSLSIAVLIIAAIFASLSIGMIFRSLHAADSLAILDEARRADIYARSCLSLALRELQSEYNYAGGNTMVFPGGECQVLSVSGSTSTNRTIHVEARVRDVGRKMELEVIDLYPRPELGSLFVGNIIYVE